MPKHIDVRKDFTGAGLSAIATKNSHLLPTP
jgi:hypothetical protein